MSAALPGSVGRYEIRRELGWGMMGVVYEAHDPALGRDVALKVIQLALGIAEEDRQAFEQRFFSEARTAARLSHPGIVAGLARGAAHHAMHGRGPASRPLGGCGAQGHQARQHHAAALRRPEDHGLREPRAAPRPRPPAAAAPPRQPQPTPRAAPATPPPGAGQTRVAGSGGETLAFPPGKRVSLAFLSGPRNGDVYVLQHPSVLIGREGGGAGAGIELADSQVSRAHAVFECHGSRCIVRDLESTNGTFVDGQRIREHELEDHGEFQIGATRLMLILADVE